MFDKKINIDKHQEFDDFSKSGLSQLQYCQERGLKYTMFRYHWERVLRIRRRTIR
ncbi:IS66 family insertion sequence element accessory protein TnpA [Leptospira noguchii]|uniref:IS66 family insertion sequence element accessory protein TnpA n=1 Tax=Leptospira noguchii TaxID=28182 RepID=UPI003B50B449